jgi:hypothetical protein
MDKKPNMISHVYTKYQRFLLASLGRSLPFFCQVSCQEFAIFLGGVKVPFGTSYRSFLTNEVPTAFLFWELSRSAGGWLAVS